MAPIPCRTFCSTGRYCFPLNVLVNDPPHVSLTGLALLAVGLIMNVQAHLELSPAADNARHMDPQLRRMCQVSTGYGGRQCRTRY